MALVKDKNYKRGASSILDNAVLMPAAADMDTLIHADGSTSDPVAISTCDCPTTSPAASLTYEMLEVGCKYLLRAHAAISAADTKLAPTTAGRVVTVSATGLWFFRSCEAAAEQDSPVRVIYVGPHYGVV